MNQQYRKASNWNRGQPCGNTIGMTTMIPIRTCQLHHFSIAQYYTSVSFPSSALELPGKLAATILIPCADIEQPITPSSSEMDSEIVESRAPT